MIKLSICIPTYNRCGYLRNAINSIINQIEDSETSDCVEITISDNCSTDNTADMISEIKGKYPNVQIVYSVADKNYGADRNYIRAVSLAHGEYCWLLGSDDEIVKNSLKLVLNELKEGHTLYIFDHNEAQLKDMKIIRLFQPFKPEVKTDTVFEFKNEKDWDFYINRCNTIGGLFSFLSVIVFKRNFWNEVSEEEYEPFVGSAFVHVAIILYMLKKHKEATLKYLANSIVNQRMENDSFYVNLYDRTMLDFDGYIGLSDIFKDSELIRNDIRHIVKNDYPSVSWKLVLLSNKKQYDNLITKLQIIGYKKEEIRKINMARNMKFLSLIIVAVNLIIELFNKKRIQYSLKKQ